MIKQFAVLSLTFLFSALNFAAVDFADGVFPELVQSGRALAMGNAFIARVDDESAPFYNPAGLGSVRSWTFHLSNLFIELNKDFAQELTAEISNTLDIVQDSFDLDELRKLHLRHPGHFSHARFSVAPNFTTRFLSFGYLYSRKARTFYGGDSNDDFEFADRSDHGPYVGANISIGGGILKMGGSLAWLRRKEIIGEADENTTFIPSPTQKSKGHMLLSTIGGRFTFPVTGLPTFAATLHNSSAKNFHPSSGYPQAPRSIKQNLVLGVSLTPKIGRKQKVHIEINYKDFNKKYEHLKNSQRWTGGIEFNFSRIFFIRGGHNNGFASGGLGIKIKTFRFDLSTYAMEKGPQFPEREDRRFILSTSFGL